MTTASVSATVRQPLWVFRGALLGASVLGMGFALAALIGYPTSGSQLALYWVAIILLAGCAMLAWLSTRFAALQSASIRGLSVRFGLLCGGCWIIEMVTANLIPVPPGNGLLWYLIVYRGAIILGLALPLVGGFVAARSTGRISVGVSVSFWAGLICGLIGYLTLMFLTFAFLGTFEHDPQTLSQFAQSHSQQPNLTLSTFIIGDSLVASVSHLVIVGIAWGTGLGTLGALLGRALRRRSSV